jgi:hypothetical protein
MIVCFITGKSVSRTDSYNDMLRNLNEESSDNYVNVSDMSKYTDEGHHYRHDVQSLFQDDEKFFESIKNLRYNFFTKVESDYLEEPENETLEVFKPDDNNTDNESASSIQDKLNKQKLIGSVYDIEEKNKKYHHIESLICDSSVMFSEDMKFLFENDELNYLHLLVRRKSIQVINSYENEHSDSYNAFTEECDDGNLIEVG